MPRQRGRRRRGQRRRRGPLGVRGLLSNVVTERGRAFFTSTAVAAVLALDLGPNNFDSRLTALGDTYELFRFTAIRARLITQVTGTANLLAVSWFNVVPTTDPNTVGLVLESGSHVAYGSGLFGSPAPVLDLTRQMLLTSQEKWFRCTQGAESDLLEHQGTIYFAASQNFSAIGIYAVVEYEIQFASPLQPTLQVRGQPVWRAPRVVACEKADAKHEDDEKGLPPGSYEVIPVPNTGVLDVVPYLPAGPQAGLPLVRSSTSNVPRVRAAP